MSDDIAGEIRGFLQDHFDDYEIDDDEDIYATGHVTSMFAVQLVAFLEREFDIEIDAGDLELDNFRTIAAMRRLVETKRES